ncbi:MAG: hypothetical protein RL456_420 [Pseudomonadota bacterium]|jgi:hypothetical protein
MRPTRTLPPSAPAATDPSRRRALAALPPLLALAAWRPARAAEGLSAAARSAMVAFDGLYIPALFLTGSAGKSDDGPARAAGAMQRLAQAWPARREALARVAPSARPWREALAAVERHLARAGAEVGERRWEASHATLEHVREALFDARRALGLAYPLDDFTAFHGAMEALANRTAAPDAQRPAIERDYAAARALWRRVERLDLDATALGLSPARQALLRQGLADEGAALGRLSQALAARVPEADLLKACAAIKGPFVKAYTAFGWPAGETPALPA